MANNQGYIQELMQAYSIEDLTNLDDELNKLGVMEDENASSKVEHPLLQQLLPKVKEGLDLREIIREEIHKRVQTNFAGQQGLGHPSTKQKVFEKKLELYDILDHLDEHIAGKSVEEIAAFFSSLMEIVSQLCLQQTDGVVVVKTRLQNFFDPASVSQTIPREFMQEINLIFSPEEITSLHMKLPDIPESDPFKPLFTTILDQSYDMVRFNELSGQLLIFMTKYFIKKLEDEGYGSDAKVLEFAERHVRSKQAFQKALNDLKVLEEVIEKHLTDRPILNEFPKYLRILLQIKAGLVQATYLQRVLVSIQKKCAEYAKARKSVAFDFNKLPNYQHELHLRQAIILSLQKDALKYTMKHLQAEFAAVQEELQRLLGDIEVMSETLDPSSPEYQALLEKKNKLQTKLEHARKKMDIVKSQYKLVDVQHMLVKESIQRFKEQQSSTAETPEIRPSAKIKTGTTPQKQKKKPQRMVMARNLRS